MFALAGGLTVISGAADIITVIGVHHKLNSAVDMWPACAVIMVIHLLDLLPRKYLH